MPTCIITGNFRESNIELNTHELAWAAGFFDGEGTSGCYQNRKEGNPALVCNISQREREPLKRFKKSVLNVGSIYYLSSGNMYRYSVHMFMDTQLVMSLLWKYLCPKKREQYKSAYTKYFQLYNPEIKRGWSHAHAAKRRTA